MGAEEHEVHAEPRSTAQERTRQGALARTAGTGYPRSRLDQAVRRFPTPLDFTNRLFSHYSERSALLRYSTAVLTIVLATAARLALEPVMGSQFPFLTFFFALVFAAWFGGLGPSLLVLGLSVVAIPLVLDPLGSLAIQSSAARLAFGLYMPLGLAVAVMGGSMRAAQLRAEASEAATRNEQHQLEEEIARRRRAEDEKESLIREQSRLLVLAEQQVAEQQGLEEQRNRLLEELEARHAFTEAVIRQVPAGILVADARTGRLFLSNQEAHRIIHGVFEPGHRVEDYEHEIELAGIHDDGSRYQPEDWPLVRVIRHGEVVKDEEIEIACGDGARLTISVNAGPVKDQAGKVVAAVAAFHDITDRMQADRAIREREGCFRRLADAIPQIVWIIRPDQTLVYLNRRWFEYTGQSEEVAYLPQRWESVVHPDDLQRVNEIARRSLGGGEPFEAEYRLRDRHGNYRWFLGRGVGVTDEAGRIVSMFGTATDIDERRRSEQAARFLADAGATLAALVDEASALEQVARLAVPHFADWCVVDMAGDDGSPRRLAVAHVDPAKVAFAHDVHRRYPPDRDASTGVHAILRSGKPELVPEVTDEMLVASARDEDYLQVMRTLGLRSYIGVPMPGRDGTLGVISFIASESGRRYGPEDLRLAQDLANRAAVAVENARLYEQLKEADRRKDEFLATLAHELRNPLAPILTALQLMARASGADHEAERAMAERLVRHLARLVDDLMDVDRISRGRIELRKEVVELAPIVARVVQTVSPPACERSYDLAVSLPEQPILVDADPTRLEQILWNLLSNAIKFTEPGGRITLTARRHDGDLVLHVRDTGIGIPAEMLPHVFEMFSRAKPSSYRGSGGVGIGLGLVKNLVALHGGTIAAHSDGPGRGSEFKIRLPILAHALPPLKSAACCEIREPCGTVEGTRRILIVDDNEDAATSLARLLALLDRHAVQVAHNGPTALALAAEFEPEVIILDIGMPGMDGHEVARRLRARPEHRHTRLLALSGWGQEKDRQRSRAAGFDHHLVKPVDLEVLRGLLASPPGHGPRKADIPAATEKQHVR